MSSRLKTLLAMLSVLVIGAVALQIWLDRPKALAPADSASCAVYRSFYDQEKYKEGLFLRTASRPFRSLQNPIDDRRIWIDVSTGETRDWIDTGERLIRDWRDTGELKMPFWRDTGQFKLVEISPNKPPSKRPIRESFDQDVSGFFEPLFASKAASIERCFDEASHQPEIYDGSHKWLSFREATLWLLGLADTHSVAILSVSPVGFSTDGRHALLWVGYDCTKFCGAEVFYLFEMRSGSWTVIGDYAMSVS